MRSFSLFIHKTNSVVPILLFETARDEATVRTLASAALAEDADCLTVEVREQDRLLFSIDRNGVFYRGHGSRFARNRPPAP